MTPNDAGSDTSVLTTKLFTVNDPGDAGDAVDDSTCETSPGNQLCTLRAAIEQADEGVAGFSSFLISIITPVNPVGATLDISAATDVTIVGQGSGTTVIKKDPANKTRVFQVECGGVLSLQDLTIDGGFALGGAGVGDGAGILALGDLTLDNVVVSNNWAEWDGGGVALEGCGGAATFTNSTITTNHAVVGDGNGHGGGVYVGHDRSLTAIDTVVTKNEAHSGGGIFSWGPLTLQRGSVTSNMGVHFGGGIYNAGGVLTTDHTTIAYNHLPGLGGGVVQWSGEAHFGAGTAISHNSAGTGGGVYLNSGTADFTGTTVSDNTGNAGGGGLFNASGTATLLDSEFVKNKAYGNGGAISNQSGAVSVSHSAVYSNATGRKSHKKGSGNGGGVYNAATFDADNSTIAFNTSYVGKAGVGGHGGGIYNATTGTSDEA